MAIKTPQRRKVKSKLLRGVTYLFDSDGEPEAVMIDLKKNAVLWEDFQDIVVARQRRKQPRIPFAEVDKSLRRLGKIR
jgi:hypothetical protein